MGFGAVGSIAIPLMVIVLIDKSSRMCHKRGGRNRTRRDRACAGCDHSGWVLALFECKVKEPLTNKSRCACRIQPGAKKPVELSGFAAFFMLEFVLICSDPTGFAVSSEWNIVWPPSAELS